MQIESNVHEVGRGPVLLEHLGNWVVQITQGQTTQSAIGPYNSCFAEGDEIATSFHPVRWALGFAVGLPCALAFACLLAKLGGNQELARACLRGLRWMIGVEFTLLVVLALIGFTYERRARKREAMRFHPPGQRVDIGGQRLHLYCTGTGGPTVVLEHGHRANYLDWYLVQPQIATFTRVCSFDRAGHGWSDASPKARVPSVMAEELRLLLHAAGEKPPYVLVGHSFGGWEAVMFAYKFRGEVAGVILVDSPAADALRPAPSPARLWLRVMQFTMPLGLPRWRGWCGGGSGEISEVKEALACRSRNFATVLQEDAAFPASANAIRSIASLGDIPLVIIARDPASGRNAEAEARHNQQQRECARLSTSSRVVIAQGSGHDVPLARPDVIVEAVKALIKLQEPAGSRGTP